jgi:hypothetical protein
MGSFAAAGGDEAQVVEPHLMTAAGLGAELPNPGQVCMGITGLYLVMEGNPFLGRVTCDDLALVLRTE